MNEKDRLFLEGDEAKIWQKYCGFLDLTLQEFMQIQEHLLREQIDLVANTALARKIIGGRKPGNMAEFRRIVPLTTYETYRPYLDEKKEDVLGNGPFYWAHTSGASGSPKWCPYTERGFTKFGEHTLAAFLLAGARGKGDVRIKEGREKVLLNLPGRPYISGWMPHGVGRHLTFECIPPLEMSEKMEFAERIEQGFRMALRSRVDFIGGLASVLVKVGEQFEARSSHMSFSWEMLHPVVLSRLVSAWVRSKNARRPLMPRDLWRVKGIICGGMDSSFYREGINRQWGVMPGDIYVATESGAIAMTSWTKTNLVFVPNSVFIELIPEKEWVRGRQDSAYQPTTVLLDEAVVGERYEIVITSFYGMPFLRYRLGDVIRFVAMEDTKAGIKLPQFEVVSRADNIIDLAGFARLGEATIWKAISDTGVKYEDWVACKSYEDGHTSLLLYIEPKEEVDAASLRDAIHEKLRGIDNDYRDLETMLGLRPLRVNLLARGTIHRYFEAKKAAGADLSHLKPPHTNAPDTAINQLLELSQAISKENTPR